MKKFDDDLEFESLNDEPRDTRFILPIIIVAVLLVIVIVALVLLGKNGKNKDTSADLVSTEQSEATETETQTTEVMGNIAATESTEEVEADDPQNGNMGTDTGASVDVTALLSAGNVTESGETTFGIDVARYQGTIDWSQVAASGVQFAMIRVGYRTQKTGEIVADSNAKYNMQEAQANGIKVGAYFFSTAITAEEAVQEADWVADYISQYQITYPVAFNCEGFENADSRQYNMTQSERTDMAIAFLNEIYNRGYTPMFYAAKNEMTGDAKWDTSRIEKTYKIWVSQYPTVPYPKTAQSDYAGTHAMWQYTNQGTVAGISKPVDVDIAYFGYAGTADAQSDVAPETVSADAEALMNFSEVNETVTAKQSTNLRNIPSQGSDATVVATLQNGDTATRTGVSSSGWSRVSYNGHTLYAVSSYLTTDLSYSAPAVTATAPADTTATDGSGSGDGLKTKFTACSDVVTAKIEVNLRTLPSVTNPDAAVVAVLKNGETVTRTGINTDYGWSRVDYNGQTLYCISSYLTSAQ